MIVSFGTCDLKLYTVKFLLFVCSFCSSRMLVYFLLRHVLTVFVKEKTLWMFLWRVMWEKNREEKARLERGGKSCSLLMFGSRLSPRMEKTKRVKQRHYQKKKRKKGFEEKSKPENMMVNQRRNNLFIVSFLLPLRCLFSLKKTTKIKTKKKKTVTFEDSWVCLSAPDVLRI